MKIKGFDKVIPYHFLSERVPSIHYYLDALRRFMIKSSQANSNDVTVCLAQLNESLARFPIRNPEMGQWAQHGFAPCLRMSSMDAPKIEDDGEPFDPLQFIHQFDPDDDYPLIRPLESGKGFIVCVETRERVLPSASIEEASRQRFEEYKEKEGNYPNRKVRAELKEQVVDSMLKRAPIRPSQVYVLVTATMIYVFTSSATRADDTLALLRTAFETLPVMFAIADKMSLSDAMQAVIMAPEKYQGVQADNYVKWRQKTAWGNDEEHADKILIRNSTLAEEMNNETTVVELAVAMFQKDQKTDEDVPMFSCKLKQNGIVSALTIIGASGQFNAGPVELSFLENALETLMYRLDKTLNIIRKVDAISEDTSEEDDDDEFDTRGLEDAFFRQEMTEDDDEEDDDEL